MLFNKNENNTNERIIHKTKSNMLFGCKKAIYGFILLIIVLCVSPGIIQFIAKMQVYLISQIQLPLTRYAAIAFFVIILVIVTYIIWQIISWYSIEYTLTDSRIIVKTGVISTKKNYIPYSTIQDINTSQNIIERIFQIGTVSVFSAYDNNQLELKNISNPSEIEDMIFSNMRGFRSFQTPPRQYNNFQQESYFDDGEYLGRNEFYDDFETITPITHERNDPPRRDYNNPVDNLNYNDKKYEYEGYNDRFDDSQSLNNYSNEKFHDNVRNNDYYYEDIEPQRTYEDKHNEKSNYVKDDSSEKVIRRHFDKFKK